MDYFFSRLFRGVKYSLSLVGALACGVVIVLGSMGVSTAVIPICGGIAIIPMGFSFFESTKVMRDLENMVTKFKTDIKNFKQQIDNLSLQVSGLKTEVNRLESMLDQAEEQLTQLKNLVGQYKDTNESLKFNLNRTEINNDKLQKNVDDLIRIKSEYESRINSLTNLTTNIQEQLDDVSKLKDDYKNNNEMLADSNKNLKAELEKVDKMYEDAKALAEVLLNSKNVLSDIYTDMVQTETKMDQNTDTMSKLINVLGIERTQELFKQLDADGDNKLSLDEFRSMLNPSEVAETELDL